MATETMDTRDEDKEIIIFRIEAPDGEGPYPRLIDTYNLEFSDRANAIADSHRDSEHPVPLGLKNHEFCAFEKLSQLKDWFRNKTDYRGKVVRTIRLAKRSGCKLVRYRIHTKFCRFGAKQLVFEKACATRI